jgi:hypothetical protein
VAGWQHLLRFWVVLSWPACLHTWFYQNTFETEQAHLWRTLAAPTWSLGGTVFGDPGQRICMRFLCNSACPDSPPSVQGPGSTNLLIKPPIPAYANQSLNEGINGKKQYPDLRRDNEDQDNTVT